MHCPKTHLQEYGTFMRRNMHISKVGLKLIKAYEGYRPVDRHLVNGHHVVGYGHMIEGDDSLVLTRKEAEELLRRDLEPYEDMVNETVHAPLTQSQYDALVSLAYNIGPRAFTESDTLRALNNGRPLDAASGFDIWRKSTINGKTYVVDALMRRRAAEKALFLRTEGKKTLPASRADLPPVKDEMVALLTTEDALPVISNNPRNGLVARVPYMAEDIEASIRGDENEEFVGVEFDVETDVSSQDDVKRSSQLSTPNPQISRDAEDEDALTVSNYTRRSEDGPSGILELSEVYEDGVPRVREGGIDDDLVDAAYEIDDFDDEYVDIALDEPQETDAELDELGETSPPPSSSLIADTASQLSDRLDALIDNVASDTGEPKAENWPESLIQARNAEEEAGVELTLDPKLSETDIGEANIVIDNLVEDDAFRERSDSAAKYINIEPASPPETTQGGYGYFIPLLIGMSLTGASAGAILGNPIAILGQWGPLLSFIGLIIGIIMTLFTIYYVLKTK